jgi:membrane protease YdiL (CAAX protease family)
MKEADGLSQSPLEGLNGAHLFVLVGCLAWAVLGRASLNELGMGKQHLRTSLAWGAVAGTILSLLARVGLALPWIRHQFQPPPEWAAIRRADLVRFLLGPMLVGSAVLEEVAFRGLLQAKLGESLGGQRGIVVGSLTFAAWHTVIAWFNLSRCGLSHVALPAAYAGALAGLFVFGGLLGVLRQTTGHIGGGILVHWMVLIGTAFGVLRATRQPEHIRIGGFRE